MWCWKSHNPGWPSWGRGRRRARSWACCRCHNHSRAGMGPVRRARSRGVVRFAVLAEVANGGALAFQAGAVIPGETAIGAVDRAALEIALAQALGLGRRAAACGGETRRSDGCGNGETGSGQCVHRALLSVSASESGGRAGFAAAGMRACERQNERPVNAQRVFCLCGPALPRVFVIANRPGRQVPPSTPGRAPRACHAADGLITAQSGGADGGDARPLAPELQ